MSLSMYREENRPAGCVSGSNDVRPMFSSAKLPAEPRPSASNRSSSLIRPDRRATVVASAIATTDSNTIRLLSSLTRVPAPAGRSR